jgi:hypothetical protein
MAIKLFEGITRKIVPAFVALSFVGWIVFVAGFGKQNKDDPTFDLKNNSLYPYWAAAVLGPIVYILAVVHALLWGFPSAIVGSVTAVLSMMYITALSAVFVTAGIYIRNPDDVFISGDVPVYYDLLFAGGFLAALFWTFVLALWPWYKVDVEGQYSGI